jgi:hypothetical protein
MCFLIFHASYDYNEYDNHNEIFNEINNFLKDYEKSQKGKISVIHGDTVLTNIIINEYNNK